MTDEESTATSGRQGRSAKKCKVVGDFSYGKIPKEFGGNIEKFSVHVHDFVNLPQQRGEYFFTGIIKAHGHSWKVCIYPLGSGRSVNKEGYVSIYLFYAGESTEKDPIVAKARIRTKTINKKIKIIEFSEEKNAQGWPNFGTREEIIKKDCNEAGTLTITVELQVATEKRSVWFPKLTSCDYTRLYKSVETSDATVMVGMLEFKLHKCVLADRTRVLYELVRTEEESFSSSEKNNCIVVLANIDATVFEVLIQFVYSGEEPKLNGLDEEIVKSILLAANRFGVTELKLYVESFLIEKFLVPSNAAGFLLFADSHSCGLLKEESMIASITDSTTFMNSEEDDWKKVQESPKLLTELLLYTSSAGAGGRKQYSSVVDDGDGTIEDANDFDVTSLRERLQKVNLDVDGSREILVERWKEYLLANNDNNNNSETTAS